jgi:formate hydrogenlyase transcriptional activator
VLLKAYVAAAAKVRHRREILTACRCSNWKPGGRRGAAARLGLKRITLFYKMKRLGIAVPPDHSQD